MGITIRPACMRARNVCDGNEKVCVVWPPNRSHGERCCSFHFLSPTPHSWRSIRPHLRCISQQFLSLALCFGTHLSMGRETDVLLCKHRTAQQPMSPGRQGANGWADKWAVTWVWAWRAPQASKRQNTSNDGGATRVERARVSVSASTERDRNQRIVRK